MNCPTTPVEELSVVNVCEPEPTEQGGQIICTTTYCNNLLTTTTSDIGLKLEFDPDKFGPPTLAGQLPSPTYTINSNNIYFESFSLAPTECKSFYTQFVAMYGQRIGLAKATIGRDIDGLISYAIDTVPANNISTDVVRFVGMTPPPATGSIAKSLT